MFGLLEVNTFTITAKGEDTTILKSIKAENELLVPLKCHPSCDGFWDEESKRWIVTEKRLEQ
jgi:hypothetical protein